MTERTWGDDQSPADGEEPPAERDEPTPNPAQRELIEHTEGVCVADAGAGTGKTFAVTRRYAGIVDRADVDPADVLLVTFTRSAATEMRERIVDQSSYSLRELADAPIQTFHSHCLDLLTEHGYRAPTHLGIDDRVTDSTRVVEDELVETELFAEFFDAFRADHPEYADQLRALSGDGELLDVIEAFAARGIVPTADGWYRNSESLVRGDREAFLERFEAANRPRNGGSKQSELREALGRYGRGKSYAPDAPAKSTVRGEDTKRVPEDPVVRAFEEDREELIAFVHDVYHEYLAFALSRNYLTFGFLQLFAFVLLCEDHALRERVDFEYVMVDEFQDTSEVQFKLALLLAGTDNLCVVGDWKQSIYSFQYADVENIRRFEERLEQFAVELNDDCERVAFDTGDVRRIELTENYRSTGTVLEFAEETLAAPATDSDDVEEGALDDVASLSANAPFDRTRVEGFRHPDECEAVLTAIQSVVGNADYAVADEDGEPRPPTYGDVAVLSRTREFGRTLLDAAEPCDVPLAYDGGVELFRSDQAKLLLAWLRILERDADRGWALVLEEAGYALDEVERVLETGEYPADAVAFREELDALPGVGAVARRVFERYGFTGEYADALLHAIQSVHDATASTRGDLIRLVERGIERGTTHEISTGAGVDSVTVQTIHGAKGLEYPIVLLANVNDGAFPPAGGGSGVLRYEAPIGLRTRKEYAEVEAHPHVYDNWTHDVLRHCLPREYDEERRLLYVAATRAEHHVILGAGEDPSTFFEELQFDDWAVEPDVQPVDRIETTQTQLPFSIVPPDGPVGYTPHTLMDDAVFEIDGDDEFDEDGDDAFDRDGGEDGDHSGGSDDDVERESAEFRGREFGDRVHDFAEAYALGEDVAATGPRAADARCDDEHNVAEFLDGLSGELHVEERAVLPLTVDGERVTISGVVDLVHKTPDWIEVIDYKTDRSRRAEAEYAKQLSVYYHVLRESFPEKTVSASVFYTARDERRGIEPLSREELAALVRRTTA